MIDTIPDPGVDVALNEVEQYLRRRGADMNARDMSDRTALQAAESKKRTQVVEYLRNRGALQAAVYPLGP